MKVEGQEELKNYILSLILRLFRKIKPHRKIYLVIILLTFYSALIFLSGALLQRSGFLRLYVKPVLLGAYRVPKNYFKGLTAKPECINIDINHTDFQKLAFKRKEAIARDVLITSDEDYVPGRIRYKGKTIKVDLRLKGDWVSHLRREKWSFRIKVRGDNTLFGMKKFSIQHPTMRNYIYEWLFHQAFKREGGIALRFNFVDVTLNGKHLGIYALEEHFEKRLIEHNAHREGPIVKFDESLYWEEIGSFGSSFLWLSGYGFYYSLPIDAFRPNQIEANPELFEQFKIASNLLENFRLNKLKPQQVFDTDKVSKYFALCDLFGSNHALHSGEFRFYYNPVTSLLEPISFDIMGGEPLVKLSCACAKADWRTQPQQGGGKAFLLANFFKDVDFFKEYIEALDRVSRTSYLDNLFGELNNELKTNLNILYKEWPHYSFSKEVLYKNQSDIRKTLNPVKGLHAYLKSPSGRYIELELGNIQLMPVEVLGVSYQGTLIEPDQEIILPGKSLDEPVSYQSSRFLLPSKAFDKGEGTSDLKVIYAILGTNNNRTVDVYPWSYLDEGFISSDFIRQEANYRNFAFLKIDESLKEIYLKPGKWNLYENLTIPKGYKLICGGNTELNLLNSAKVLSYSPLVFIGSQDNPIIICSKDSTGQGIVVIKAKAKSVFRHVIFDNLSSPAQRGWQLTGAVTCYESPVEFYKCQFLNNSSEDALNIIRTDFLITKSFFSKNSSDAIDIDFGKGEITESSFMECGNDAIDICGSVVDLRSLFINGAKDKGLSIGENSWAEAKEIKIENSELAIASKDLSKFNVKEVSISNCKVGLAVYQKKPEFGPASLVVANLRLNATRLPYLVEEGSLLTVNSKNIESYRKNVWPMVDKKEYGEY